MKIELLDFNNKNNYYNMKQRVEQSIRDLEVACLYIEIQHIGTNIQHALNAAYFCLNQLEFQDK